MVLHYQLPESWTWKQVIESERLKLAFPADTCSHCKTVSQGSAMKVMNGACYLCGIHKDDLVKPNRNLCADCIRLGKRVCFHHAVTDERIASATIGRAP